MCAVAEEGVSRRCIQATLVYRHTQQWSMIIAELPRLICGVALTTNNAWPYYITVTGIAAIYIHAMLFEEGDSCWPMGYALDGASE